MQIAHSHEIGRPYPQAIGFQLNDKPAVAELHLSQINSTQMLEPVGIQYGISCLPGARMYKAEHAQFLSAVLFMRTSWHEKRISAHLEA